MRVLYDHQIFSSQTYGGISRYFVKLIENISAGGYIETIIFSPWYVNNYIKSLTNTKVVGIKFPLKKTGKIRAAANNLCANNIRRYSPSLIHQTDYSSAIKHYTKQFRIPTVITFHDMIHEKFPEYFADAEHTVQTKALCAQNADCVICVSEQTKKDVLEQYDGVLNKEPIVVHHGCDFHNSNFGGKNVFSFPYLLYVGMRSAYKNFALFLTAIATSRKLSKDFDVVCFGGGTFTKDERLLISKLQLRVHHLSGTDAELADLYRYARAFVFPSLYEGFGLPLLEAMSMDCPVVCSNKGALSEVAGEAACYFEPLEIDSINTAIENVVYSEQNRIQLISEGRNRLPYFTWENCAARTLQAYSKVAR